MKSVCTMWTYSINTQYILIQKWLFCNFNEYVAACMVLLQENELITFIFTRGQIFWWIIASSVNPDPWDFLWLTEIT